MEKERISALEYIQLTSVGDLEKCRRGSDIVYEWLKKEYEDKRVEGCQVYVIKNTVDIENKLLLIQYKKITNDIFPFLYVAIQPTDKSNIDSFETKMLSLGYTKVDPLDNWEQAGDLYDKK